MFKQKMNTNPLDEIADQLSWDRRLSGKVERAIFVLRSGDADRDINLSDKKDIDLDIQVRGTVLASHDEIKFIAYIQADDEQIRDNVNPPETRKEKALNERSEGDFDWEKEPEFYWGSGNYGRVISKDGFNLHLLCTKKELPHIRALILSGIEMRNMAPIIEFRITHPDYASDIGRMEKSFYEKNKWEKKRFCVSGWSLRLDTGANQVTRITAEQAGKPYRVTSEPVVVCCYFS